MTKRASFNKKFVFLKPSLSLTELITYINADKNNWFELGLVVDEKEVLLGVLDNLDIIKAMPKSIHKEIIVKDVMNSTPIKINHNLSPKEIIKKVKKQVNLRTNGIKDLTRFIPLVNEFSKVVDVVDIYELIAEESIKNENIEIYGLGFVGITLAASLASVGHKVIGIDINKDLIENLNKGEMHVLEPGLSDLTKAMIRINRLSFSINPPSKHNSFYIVCVGTPVNNKGEADLKDLIKVLKIISARMKKGDTVMLRSTVPVGTTREIAKNILESKNDLLAGKDFHLAFTPERTVEGNAVEELRKLPQIVGGLTPNCQKIATSFWQTLAKVVIPTNNLEAAELVKLINNSFRDLTFAFSNALALTARNYNIDANELVYYANEGYPRNHIARPSPGVGGYCLTKDPLLYASTDKNSLHAKLSILGRKINENIANYPYSVFVEYLEKEGLKLYRLRILIIGIAFKGWPETNDIRGSTSLYLAQNLKNKCAQLKIYDAVVSEKQIISLGLDYEDIYSLKTINFDAIFIMNNHPQNIKNNFINSLSKNRIFIFDGWNILEKSAVIGFENIRYCNLGFSSFKNQ
tara:strand:- start:50849 stop:52582 length:1734 start_codon:yes stop_codon:yes gene_type:complete